MRKITATLLTAMLIAVTLGCSADQPTPSRQGQELGKTLEAVSQELRALQTQEAGRSVNKETTPRPTRGTAKPSSNRTDKSDGRIKEQTPTTVPTPTPTPTPLVLKVDTGPGICGRSPEVQVAIIKRLEITLCQAITTPELFRVTSLSINTETLKAGDLAGMENLRTLSMTVEHIETGAINNLTGIKELSIKIRDKGWMDESAITSMSKLESLEIYGHDSLTMATGALSNLPVLKTLKIETNAPGKIQDNAVSNLPELETLTIYWETPRNSEERVYNTMGTLRGLPSLKTLSLTANTDYENVSGPSLPSGILEELPSLEELHVGMGNNSIRLKEETFSNNPELKSVAIGGRISGTKNTFRNLHKLEELSISNRVNEGDERVELHLSPNSPLMKDILNGDRSPNGYRIIPPGAD